MTLGKNLVLVGLGCCNKEMILLLDEVDFWER